MAKCDEFATAFGPYVEYWKRVLSELKEPLPKPPPELLEGYWPTHDWRVTDQEASSQGRRVNSLDSNPEEEELEPYCGPANEAPRESFNPWVDICPGSWVLLGPEDPEVCLVWQGRALSEVCREAGHEKNEMFLI